MRVSTRLTGSILLASTCIVALAGGCGETSSHPGPGGGSSGGSGESSSVSSGSAGGSSGSSGGSTGSSSGSGGSSGSGDAGPPADAAVGDASSAPDAATTTVPALADVIAVMERAANYQVSVGPGAADADWVDKWPEAVFYMGVMATYTTTKDALYLTDATKWSTGNQWTLLDGTTSPPTRSADNQSAGQVYTEIYLLDPVAANAGDFKNSQASIDAMIAMPDPGDVDWWWCDALFMAPPLITRLGAATGESKYFPFLDTMWSSASTALFDPVHELFWRDSTFVGTDTYWSRGNGWVMGGLVRVLEYLPANDPQRGSYVAMLQTLAASVAPLQGSDGLWRSDLLDPSLYPNPETSGTGLFAYAMAWGINNAVLDRTTYLPVVVDAWAGLVANVDAQGRLGYCQGTGSAPAAATADDSYDYGVGAFLLAGSEVAKLQ